MIWFQRGMPQSIPRATSRWLLVVILPLCSYCRGKTAGGGDAADSSTAALGGASSVAAGTTSNAGGNAITSTTVTDGAIVPNTSAGSQAGAGGDLGDTCDVTALWTAIVGQTGGVTACWEASPMLEPGEELGPLRGAVVIDDEGRVVDLTGRTGERKQQFLDKVADKRWPCLAGQTIGYECARPK
jgi:hypothetical protein